MSEWQPAIVHILHNYGKPDRERSVNGKRIRVRESILRMIDPHPDCDATRFFIVHPDDVAAFAPWSNGAIVAICEHEILTD